MEQGVYGGCLVCPLYPPLYSIMQGQSYGGYQEPYASTTKWDDDADWKRNFPTRTFWACVWLSKRRPAFFDDEIQGGLPLSLKRQYKTIPFACKSLFSALVIQYKQKYILCGLVESKCKSTLSISSPANLNVFSRFGLPESWRNNQSERQVSFPLLSSEPVRLDAVRSLTVQLDRQIDRQIIFIYPRYKIRQL